MAVKRKRWKQYRKKYAAALYLGGKKNKHKENYL